MTEYSEFASQLEDALLSPADRTLLEEMDDVLSEHETEIIALQAYASVIPVSATTVSTAAECDAAYLAATGVAASIGDLMVAVVSAAQKLLIKTAAAAWDYIAFEGELTT